MKSATGSRVIGAVLTIALTGMAIGLLFGTMEESRFVHDPTPVFALVAGGAVFFALLRGPVGRAIGRMLESSSGQDDQLTERIEQLEDRVAEISADQRHVAELEERLDFAERLLAQRLPAAQLERMDTPV